MANKPLIKYIEDLPKQRDLLVDILKSKGIDATKQETFNTLIPKISDIESSGHSEFDSIPEFQEYKFPDIMPINVGRFLCANGDIIIGNSISTDTPGGTAIYNSDTKKLELKSDLRLSTFKELDDIIFVYSNSSQYGGGCAYYRQSTREFTELARAGGLYDLITPINDVYDVYSNRYTTYSTSGVYGYYSVIIYNKLTKNFITLRKTGSGSGLYTVEDLGNGRYLLSQTGMYLFDTTTEIITEVIKTGTNHTKLESIGVYDIYTNSSAAGLYLVNTETYEGVEISTSGAPRYSVIDNRIFVNMSGLGLKVFDLTTGKLTTIISTGNPAFFVIENDVFYSEANKGITLYNLATDESLTIFSAQTHTSPFSAYQQINDRVIFGNPRTSTNAVDSRIIVFDRTLRTTTSFLATESYNKTNFIVHKDYCFISTNTLSTAAPGQIYLYDYNVNNIAILQVPDVSSNRGGVGLRKVGVINGELYLGSRYGGKTFKFDEETKSFINILNLSLEMVMELEDGFLCCGVSNTLNTAFATGLVFLSLDGEFTFLNDTSTTYTVFLDDSESVILRCVPNQFLLLDKQSKEITYDYITFNSSWLIKKETEEYYIYSSSLGYYAFAKDTLAILDFYSVNASSVTNILETPNTHIYISTAASVAFDKLQKTFNLIANADISKWYTFQPDDDFVIYTSNATAAPGIYLYENATGYFTELYPSGTAWTNFQKLSDTVCSIIGSGSNSTGILLYDITTRELKVGASGSYNWRVSILPDGFTYFYGDGSYSKGVAKYDYNTNEITALAFTLAPSTYGLGFYSEDYTIWYNGQYGVGSSYFFVYNRKTDEIFTTSFQVAVSNVKRVKISDDSFFWWGGTSGTTAVSLINLKEKTGKSVAVFSLHPSSILDSYFDVRNGTKIFINDANGSVSGAYCVDYAANTVTTLFSSGVVLRVVLNDRWLFCGSTGIKSYDLENDSFSDLKTTGSWRGYNIQDKVILADASKLYLFNPSDNSMAVLYDGGLWTLFGEVDNKAFFKSSLGILEYNAITDEVSIVVEGNYSFDEIYKTRSGSVIFIQISTGLVFDYNTRDFVNILSEVRYGDFCFISKRVVQNLSTKGIKALRMPYTTLTKYLNDTMVMSVYDKYLMVGDLR